MGVGAHCGNWEMRSQVQHVQTYNGEMFRCKHRTCNMRVGAHCRTREGRPQVQHFQNYEAGTRRCQATGPKVC